MAGDPCFKEYREKRNTAARMGKARWSRWCMGCDYAARACKCPPKRFGE